MARKKDAEWKNSVQHKATDWVTADRVIIYEDYIQIKFTFAKTKDYNFDPPTKEELVENGQKNNLGVTDVMPRCGGEGALLFFP